MHAIVGLGNPGKRYEYTKHNVGFITLDYLAERHGIKINKIKHKALIGEGSINGQKVLLVKPQTFMNLSGNAVREVLDYYKLDPNELIVVFDDADIEMGRLRIRSGGSAGTHNGMKSIIQSIQIDHFPRIKIGIGRGKEADLASYVLGGFGKKEKDIMEKAIDRAAGAIECLLKEGIASAMNTYNVWEPDADKNER